MDEVNILATLFSNPGLLHVAEHVISFLDDKSVAQYRLVSKRSCEFLDNIWRDRMLRAARQLCQKRFEVYENLNYSEFDNDTKIDTCIFELWPDWKNALFEIQSFEDLNVVIYLLQQYFIQWESSPDLEFKTSPIHFAAEHCALFEEKEPSYSIKIFKILIETSLDFSVLYCIDDGNTPFLTACESGSQEVVGFLLDNAVKKGIEVQSVSPNGTRSSAATCAVLSNDAPMVKYLFDRRNEFDFGVDHGDLHISVYQNRGTETFEIILEWLLEKGVSVNEEYGGKNVLHLACQYNSEVALFLLQNYEKFGIERSVVVSMTNLADEENKRPIDLARENIYVDPLRDKVIQELEKFT